MSSFNLSQDQFLRNHFTNLLQNSNDLALIQEIKDLHILESIDKSAFEESTANDVRLVLEGMTETKLTDEQFSRVCHRVMDYDYSDYNEYISAVIEDVLDLEESNQ